MPDRSEWLANWAAPFAVLVSVAALIVAIADGCVARGATQEELRLIRQQVEGDAQERELFRRQVLGSVRPTLIPTSWDFKRNRFSTGPQPSSVLLTMTIENISDAPSLGGMLTMASPGPEPEADEDSAGEGAAQRFPTCRGYNPPAPGRFAAYPLTPLRAKESQDIALHTGFDNGVGCFTALYLDGSGTEWVTDWVIEWQWEEGIARTQTLSYLQSYPVPDAGYEWIQGDVPRVLWEPPSND